MFCFPSLGGMGVFFLLMCACGGFQGTPSALKNPSDETWATDETSSRRKSTPGDASMRRSIQDLVLSIDPNVKIEPEVEDVRPLCLFLIPRRFPCSRTTFFLFLFSCLCPRVYGHSFSWTSPTSSSTQSLISAAVSRSTAAATRWKLGTYSFISVRAQISLLRPPLRIRLGQLMNDL